ncbi:MAG: ATP-binding protein [Desulfobulbaceae bacterium]|nr:ATP-binding protein [Desulfobulbaceae bacterium]
MLNIKRKTTLIVMSIIVGLSAVHAGSAIYWSHRSAVEEQAEQRLQFERSYEQIASRLDNYLSKRVNGLLVQDDILKAFRDRDRNKLYSLTEKKFEVIRKELPGYPILHFHTPDHKSFLRVHKPNFFDDELKALRPMVTKVIHTRKEEKGFEVGKFAIIYRVVRPVFYEGEFLGVLEIGGDIGFVMNELRLLFGLPSAFYATPESLATYKLGKEFKQVSGRLLYSTNNEPLFNEIEQINFKNGGKQEIDGKQFALLVSDPIVDTNGRLLGNIVSLHDLSRMNALQRKSIVQTMVMTVFLLLLVSVVLEKSFGRMVADLEASNRLAMKAEKAKGEFLANMSHEIRTPMNAIVGMTRLALKTPLDERQQYLIGSVKTASDSLLGLLNDILDLSKIEAGQLQLDKHVFAISSLLDSVRSMLTIAAVDKNLELRVADEFGDLPEFVEGDELRLRQILVNLVSNAIKFTPRGSVEVKVGRESADLGAGMVLARFSVMDTGIGIPLEHQDAIFTIFRQGDSSTARQFGGTGLGLAICKQLVEVMGGRIWLESEPGKGASFHFSVPLAVAKKIDQERQEKLFDVGVRQLRILLVEDNMANRELARMVLEEAGHAVATAVDGLDALRVVAEQDIDAVLMDVQMPVMDGYAACGIIRDCEQGKEVGDVHPDLVNRLTDRLRGGHLAIIAMTANAMQGDKEKCLQAGMDDYLTKPFLPDQVAAALRQAGNAGIIPS